MCTTQPTCVGMQHLRYIYIPKSMYATIESWVLVYWPKKDSTSVVRDGHQIEGKMGSDFVI